MTKIELPDFDEFYKLAEDIKVKYIDLENLKLTIEKLEKSIITVAMGDEKYYVNGKAPSMDFIKNTFRVTGFNGELIPMREEQIKLEADLDYMKRRYEILKLACDMWRTQSSNERLSLT